MTGILFLMLKGFLLLQVMYFFFCGMQYHLRDMARELIGY